MAKKKNLPKKATQEEVQPFTPTDQDSQYDVVPSDAAPLSETAEETSTQQIIPDQVEANLNVETQQEAPVEIASTVEAPQEPKPKPKPLTMVSLKQELDDLRAIVQAQSQQITDSLSGPILQRKPVANGKVQIKDTQTGKVYPSKNNTYKTLLKAGELKDLVDQGILGDNPDKNSFGWYAINRYFKNRFIEVKPEAEEPQNEAK